MIQIKGIREGLLVSLGEGEWGDLRDALMSHVDQQENFLRGGRMAIDVKNLPLSASDLGQLRDDLSGKGIALWAVVSDSPKTTQAAQLLGMATRLGKPLADRPKAKGEFLIAETAVFVKRTLRSGSKLQSPSHVTVIGDVNPGAEIIAGGDVIVWGRLRGVVHAGVDGDESAVICALDLSPTQLRIAGLIALSPNKRSKPQPEVARIKDGKVIAESWNIKEK